MEIKLGSFDGLKGEAVSLWNTAQVEAKRVRTGQPLDSL